MSLLNRLCTSGLVCLRTLQSITNSRIVLQSVLPSAGILQSKRCFTRTCPRLDGYQGDGKTTATSLDKELAKYLIVESYNEDGFRLSNGSFAIGPIILFPNIIFQWKVKTLDDINHDSLTLFKLLEPKLDLLIIGIGEPGYWSAKSLFGLKKDMSTLGINVEIMPTRDAVATYNFMLADFRVVAGAFLPTLSHVEAKLLGMKKN